MSDADLDHGGDGSGRVGVGPGEVIDGPGVARDGDGSGRVEVKPGEVVDGPGGVALWRVAEPVEVAVDLGSDVAEDDPRRIDRVEVERLLGRPPRSSFAVVVRRLDTGAPVVIRNPPLLDDGTPMPTRYWLVAWNAEVGTLEAAGGVRAAEADIDPDELAAAHARYAAERDAALPAGWTGPTPSGGVGGTRQGVKCLHTHYAHWLVTGDDPVGAWTHAHLLT